MKRLLLAGLTVEGPEGRRAAATACHAERKEGEAPEGEPERRILTRAPLTADRVEQEWDGEGGHMEPGRACPNAGP